MEYREVTLKTRHTFGTGHQDVLRSFLDEFDTHIYFEPKGKKEVKLFVNNLDVEKFKTRALELKADKSGDAVTVDLIDDFVEAVDGIRIIHPAGRKKNIC